MTVKQLYHANGWHLKIMSPERPYFILTADVPYCKAYVLVLHCFDVKTLNENHNQDILDGKLIQTYGGDSSNNLSKF